MILPNDKITVVLIYAGDSWDTVEPLDVVFETDLIELASVLRGGVGRDLPVYFAIVDDYDYGVHLADEFFKERRAMITIKGHTYRIAEDAEELQPYLSKAREEAEGLTADVENLIASLRAIEQAHEAGDWKAVSALTRLVKISGALLEKTAKFAAVYSADPEMPTTMDKKELEAIEQIYKAVNHLLIPL